jgi:hypothetical protein
MIALIYCRRNLRILPPESTEKIATRRARSNRPGPSKAEGQQDAARLTARSKARTVGGAAAHRRARIKMQGRVTAPAAIRMKEMGGINAAIDVGKHQLEVALGSKGELFTESNQARAIARLAKRLAQLDCERVLIEGGSYQNVLVGALRAAELPVVIINPRRVRELPRALGSWPRPTISMRESWRHTANGFSRRCGRCPTSRIKHYAGSGSGANS